ncbi:MAG: nucleotidyltransferase domain-containing protein, partial [Proteobacteria bacterium]
MLQELLADGLRDQPNVCAAYLFGSCARGTQRPGSDVDVGIWLRKTPVTFDECPLELAGALEH